MSSSTASIEDFHKFAEEHKKRLMKETSQRIKTTITENRDYIKSQKIELPFEVESFIFRRKKLPIKQVFPPVNGIPKYWYCTSTSKRHPVDDDPILRCIPYFDSDKEFDEELENFEASKFENNDLSEEYEIKAEFLSVSWRPQDLILNKSLNFGTS